MRRRVLALAACGAALASTAVDTAGAAAVRGSPADPPRTASAPDIEREAIVGAIDAIDTCLARLDPAVHRGYARIERACPQVAARLADPALRARLAAAPAAAGSAYGVAILVATRDAFGALLALAAGPAASAPGRAGSRVDARALRERAASLAGDAGAGAGLQWLRHRFGLDAQAPAVGGSEAGRPPPGAGVPRRLEDVASVLGGLALLALVGLVAWHVVSRLRPVRRRERGDDQGRRPAPASAGSGAVVPRAAAAEPARLLDEVAARLRCAQPRLATDHLTARELLTLAGAMPELAALADVAERLRFAAQPPAERAVEAALAAARRRLGTAPGVAA